MVKGINLLLQAHHLRRHRLVLVRVLEIVGAAVGGVKTRQVEVAASLARSLAIALDLASFAFVAGAGMTS